MRGLGLLLVCAACGDGLPASTADAGPDDPRGLVSLAFLAADGERLVGHRVFFQDRDSSLVLSTRTDAEGRANAFMHPGGFVSLVETRGNSSLIYTYAGVKPGDELTIDQRGTPGNVVEIEVSIPPAAGAITYQLYTSCNHGGSIDLTGAEVQPVHTTIFGCEKLESFLVVAFFPDGMHRYLYRGQVQLQPFASLVFDGSYRDVESTVVTVQNGPPAIVRGFVSQELAGIKLPSTFAELALVAGSGSATVELPRPPGATVATRIDLDNGASIGVHRATLWGPASSITSIDLGGGLRPYTRRPWFERTSNSIRWEESATGRPADSVLVGLGWARFTTVFNYQWVLVGPRGSDAMIQLPVLPEPELNPAEDETPNPFTLVNFSVEGGYDRVRARLLAGWSAGEQWPVDGASGTVIYQELGVGDL